MRRTAVGKDVGKSFGECDASDFDQTVDTVVDLTPKIIAAVAAESQSTVAQDAEHSQSVVIRTIVAWCLTNRGERRNGVEIEFFAVGMRFDDRTYCQHEVAIAEMNE